MHTEPSVAKSLNYFFLCHTLSSFYNNILLKFGVILISGSFFLAFWNFNYNHPAQSSAIEQLFIIFGWLFSFNFIYSIIFWKCIVLSKWRFNKIYYCKEAISCWQHFTNNTFETFSHSTLSMLNNQQLFCLEKVLLCSQFKFFFLYSESYHKIFCRNFENVGCFFPLFMRFIHF